MSKTQFRKILIVKNRALGDSVFGLSVFRYFKSLYPAASLTYALPAWIVPLYQKVESDVDSFLEMDLKSFSGQLNFLNEIRKGQYDLILELHDSPRSTRVLKLARFLFGIPLFGHNHHMSFLEKTGVHDQGIRKSIIQRDLDGAYSCARFFDPSQQVPNFLDFQPRLKVKGEEKGQEKVIVFGIVATRNEKKWPIKHYASLIKLLKEKLAIRAIVPVSGSPEDQKLIQGLEELAPGLIEPIQVPLNDLPESLGQGDLYIGNDTGLKHISAALGLKTLTLFGPEEPLEWHPYSKEDHPYFWIYDCDVRSKMVDVCLLEQFDQTRSLEEIQPSEVFSVTMALLEKN